ncbi:MAG TPA: hypothetical protein VKK31_28925 [Thermoanaerobaculia bacterium]|nr:hypothetical protein [Thermoanaerobaculia bacterium]
MIRRPLLSLLALGLAAVALAAATSPPSATLTSVIKTAGDPQASRTALEQDPAGYAWDLFLALSSPLTGPGPKVWETTYRQTSTIYLATGQAPALWGSGQGPCGPGIHDLDTSIQVDGLSLNDKWGQPVRYQLLMNEPAFNYLVSRGFYNVNGQEAAAAAGLPADFPPDSFELKTSWIWIGQDPAKLSALQGKYYIANACYEIFDRDGRPAGWQTGSAALAGMHIINKLLPTWVWITFENIYNDQFTQAKLELPIAPPVQAANQSRQQQLQGLGSVFANYQLDGVQTTFNQPGTTTPTLLANSTIETAFQTQSSCITCHSTASITPNGAYFNFVDTSGGNVSYYVGTPPDLHAKGYVPLDFVWSMKRASRLKTPQTAAR